MTFTEAAAEVLRLAGKPLHYKEITELAIEKNLLSHVGKSPEITMGARLAALLKKEDKTNPIVRVKPGVFALRDWDSKRGKRAAKDEGEHDVDANDPNDGPNDGESDSTDVNAFEVEAVARDQREPNEGRDRGTPSQPQIHVGDDEDDDQPIVSGDDQVRADLAASAAELFDDEDDDDQPILGGGANAAQGGAQGGLPGIAGGPDSGPDGGRRRRRRRRRGRGGDRGDFAGEPGAGTQATAPAGNAHARGVPQDRPSGPRLESRDSRESRESRDSRLDGSGNAQITPQAIISVDAEGSVDGTRDPLAPAPRPRIHDRQQIMAGGSPTGIEVPIGEGEELAGRDLADAAAIVLGSFDRNAGPVPLRSVVDALMRRGRLGGDPAAASVQLSASLRADNLRRTSLSQRPRFRVSNGGRVALTDWILGGDLARLEQDVVAAVERYRDAARRTMLRRVQELPGHAFVELALLALERAGMTQLKAIRRAGSPGGEAHFCGVHRTGTDEIRTAVIIRKDGREIGRERVTDLRGALHHYGPATAGWLVTTGQVLSGAREEASAITASPVALFDGLAFCKLLEEHDVAVIKTRFPIFIPDLEVFDSLRG